MSKFRIEFESNESNEITNIQRVGIFLMISLINHAVLSKSNPRSLPKSCCKEGKNWWHHKCIKKCLQKLSIFWFMLQCKKTTFRYILKLSRYTLYVSNFSYKNNYIQKSIKYWSNLVFDSEIRFLISLMVLNPLLKWQPCSKILAQSKIIWSKHYIS